MNKRAEIVWRLREALDPQNPSPTYLPPDPRLRADLAAYKWELKPAGIQIRSRDKMKSELGRSPDDGDAVCLANIATMKIDAFDGYFEQTINAKGHDRYARLGG